MRIVDKHGHVVVVGSINIDWVLYTPHLLRLRRDARLRCLPSGSGRQRRRSGGRRGARRCVRGDSSVESVKPASSAPSHQPPAVRCEHVAIDVHAAGAGPKAQTCRLLALMMAFPPGTSAMSARMAFMPAITSQGIEVRSFTSMQSRLRPSSSNRTQTASGSYCAAKPSSGNRSAEKTTSARPAPVLKTEPFVGLAFALPGGNSAVMPIASPAARNSRRDGMGCLRDL